MTREELSVINVLTFHCSDCNEMINGGDYESADMSALWVGYGYTNRRLKQSES